MKKTLVGLYWFSNDYSQIEDVVGTKEFHPSDLEKKADVFPVGFHNDHTSNASGRPRGRVSIIRGNVVVNVGLKCPDEAIQLVVKALGLELYANSLHINRGYHWDAK